MKQFKNRFAVQGNLEDLKLFEACLLSLGYKNVNEDGQDVESFRSSNGYLKTKFITCGLHKGDEPGTYRPAMNNGNAGDINSDCRLFSLPNQYSEAIDFAFESKTLNKCSDTDNDGKCADCSDEPSLCPNKLRFLTSESSIFFPLKPWEQLDEIGKFKFNNWYTWGQAFDSLFCNWKKPIFITNDGVKCYNGDSVWVVHSEVVKYDTVSKITFNPNDISYNLEGMRTNQKDNAVKYFSTRRLAEEYLEDNKIIFTTDDNVNLKGLDQYYGVYFKNDNNASLETPLWTINGPFSAIILKNVERSKECKFFSTKKAAQEYVDKNRVIFTTEDGVKIYKGDKPWYVNDKTWTITHWSEGVRYYNPHPHLHYFSNHWSAVNFVNKNKVIFVSEDGYDIKKGDVVYYVNEKEWILRSWYGVRNFNPTSTIHYFKNESAAKTYLLENSPLFSVKQIREAVKTLSVLYPFYSEKQFLKQNFNID